MLRKLLMTSVLVFIRPGTPGQLSAGAMITFFFLLLGLFWRPFCSSILNNLNSGTLIAQFLTLFVGIMKERLDAIPAGTGGGDESLDRAIMAFMVVAVNGVALAWPFVHKVLSGKLADYYNMTMEVYYWCCSKYARWCGSKEQRAQIAAADAKIKKKKQKEKQMAKEAETAAKAARVNAGAHNDTPLVPMYQSTTQLGWGGLGASAMSIGPPPMYHSTTQLGWGGIGGIGALGMSPRSVYGPSPMSPRSFGAVSVQSSDAHAQIVYGHDGPSPMSPRSFSAVSVQSSDTHAQIVYGHAFGLDPGTRDKSGMYDEEMGKVLAEDAEM